MIADALLHESPDSWERGVSKPRLHFHALQDCNEDPSPEIKILIHETQYQGCSAANCVRYDEDGFDPVINSAFAATHWEWTRVRVHFLESQFTTFVINHEFGHVLGLADGGPSASVPGDPPCPTDPKSIMHAEYYGCVPPAAPADYDEDWPSSTDFETVRSFIPGPVGGSGGWNKKGFV